MGFNSEVEIPGPGDIGKKVSIRLHNEDPQEALFRDILGILETTTSVRRKNGELAPFRPERIVYWKVVPVKD